MLNTIIKKISNNSPRFLLIGDIMLDKYIFGSVDRISPEAPVPIVKFSNEKKMLGGCGNVLRNLKNLGANISVISAVGDDSVGKHILEYLSADKISTSGIQIINKNRSTKKVRIIADGQQIARLDWDMEILKNKDSRSIANLIKNNLKNYDGVIVSDYKKGVCSSIVMKKILNTAIDNSVPVFIDPKGDNWDKYRCASLITPNKKEVELVVEKKLQSNKDFEFAGKKICKDYNIDACLITRGPDGMSYVSSQKIFHLKSNAREIFDVSGAGDTVIAAISSAIISNLPIKDAVDFANKAAGIVVGHIGTSAINIDELRRLK